MVRFRTIPGARVGNGAYYRCTLHSVPFVSRGSVGLGSLMSLPRSSKPFFGREADTARVLAVLRDPDRRLISLTGLGGIGKTALAMNVAEAIAPEFPDGVHWVGLAAIAEARLAPAEIARQLGVSEVAGQSTAAALAEFLTGKNVLLVLDNLEHVLEARALIAQLIALPGPGPRLLVTSRVRLQVPGETWVEIGPLTLPGLATGARMNENEAVKLFAWRASAAGLDFRLSSRNIGDVAEICRVLDGIPLAIELAASRLHLLGTRGLLDHLRPRRHVLRTESDEFPDRHRAMADAIAWSYDQLGDRGELFRRLCVFTRGFTLDGAAAIGRPQAGEDAAADVLPSTLLDDLEELVRLSLVRTRVNADGVVRYEVLETIREYGLSLLSSEESESTRWALARYLLQLAEQARMSFDTEDGPAVIGRLHEEHDNIRGVLSWLLSQGVIAAETSVRFCTALWVFWKTQGYSREGKAWLERTVEQSSEEQGPAKARLILVLGHFEFDLERSEQLYEQARQLFRRAGDQRGEAEALGGLGMLYEQRGDYDRAAEAHRAALALWESHGNEMGMALASFQLGYAAVRAGHYAESLKQLDVARQRWERGGDTGGVAYATMEMARCYRLMGRLDESRLLLSASRDRFARAGLRETDGIVEMELGLTDLTAGRLHDALDQLKRALRDILAVDAAPTYVLEAIEGLAAVASASGSTNLALRLVAYVEHRRAQSGLVAPRSSRELVESVLERAGADTGAGAAALDLARVEAPLLTQAQIAELANEIKLAQQPAPVREDTLLSEGASRASSLTKREREVLQRLADGHSDQEIGEALFISKRTASTHVSSILAKLEVTSRTSAIAMAYRLGLIEPPRAD